MLVRSRSENFVILTYNTKWTIFIYTVSLLYLLNTRGICKKWHIQILFPSSTTPWVGILQNISFILIPIISPLKPFSSELYLHTLNPVLEIPYFMFHRAKCVKHSVLVDKSKYGNKKQSDQFHKYSHVKTFCISL